MIKIKVRNDPNFAQRLGWKNISRDTSESLLRLICLKGWSKLICSWMSQNNRKIKEHEAKEDIHANIDLIIDAINEVTRNDSSMTPMNVMDTWWYDFKDNFRRQKEANENTKQEPEPDSQGVQAYSFDLGERIISDEGTIRIIEDSSCYVLSVMAAMLGPCTKKITLQREAMKLRQEQREEARKVEERTNKRLEELGIHDLNELQPAPEGLIDEHTMCHGIRIKDHGMMIQAMAWAWPKKRP